MLLWCRRLFTGLNILNWVLGLLAVAALSYIGFVAPDLFAQRLQGNISQYEAALQWLRWTVVLTTPIIFFAHLILTRLIAIIDDALVGTPFTAINAARLRHVAGALLSIQLLDLAFGWISVEASAQTGEYFGWSFGFTGWLAVLLLFVLAQIFERGAAMQQELEQTI